MKHHLVLIYHSFEDPIFKGLMLRYLQRFQQTESGKHTFHLITFENPSYALSENEIKEKQRELVEDHNLYWYPKKYHTGGAFMLIKKLFDFLNAALLTVKLKYKYKITTVIGFTSISAAIAFVIAKILGLKSILFNIEPHSDYMVDFGYWSSSSTKYKLLNYLEGKLMSHGDHVAVPTQNAFAIHQSEDRKGKLYFVPTCIETKDFNFSSEARQQIREELGIGEEQKLIIYVGKFGGIYHTMEEMASVLKEIKENNKKAFFYIITPDDIKEVERIFNEYHLAGSFRINGKIPYEVLSNHISAADYGIMLVPSHPSQQFRCPIKTANYLACGIPYIITPSIGDDSFLAEKEHVGIVLKEGKPLELNVNFEPQRMIDSVERNRGMHLMVNWMSEVLSDAR